MSEPIYIDFSKPLDKKHAALLHEFLAKDETSEKGKKVKAFHQNIQYAHGDQVFILSHTIVRSTDFDPITGKSKLPKKYSYTVFDESKKGKVGGGGEGQVYDVSGELHHISDEMVYLPPANDQVIKLQYYETNKDQNKQRAKFKQEDEFTRLAHSGKKKLTTEKDQNERIASYIVSEKHKGLTLSDVLKQWKQNPPKISERISLSISLLEALDQLHQKGILHRDIKPENIIVNLGPPISAKIIDFGLSAKIGSDDILEGGTPFYTPPESGTMKSSEMNQAAFDNFQMGLILRELWGEDQTVEREESKKPHQFFIARLDYYNKNASKVFTPNSNQLNEWKKLGVDHNPLVSSLTAFTSRPELRSSLPDAINTFKTMQTFQLNFFIKRLEDYVRTREKEFDNVSSLFKKESRTGKDVKTSAAKKLIQALKGEPHEKFSEKEIHALSDKRLGVIAKDLRLAYKDLSQIRNLNKTSEIKVTHNVSPGKNIIK